jgi:hypothetical protein
MAMHIASIAHHTQMIGDGRCSSIGNYNFLQKPLQTYPNFSNFWRTVGEIGETFSEFGTTII